MTISAAFGKILRKMRMHRNLSQSALAAASKLDRTFISLLERGNRQPTLGTIFCLARVLKIEPNELVRQTERLVTRSGKKSSIVPSKRL